MDGLMDGWTWKQWTKQSCSVRQIRYHFVLQSTLMTWMRRCHALKLITPPRVNRRKYDAAAVARQDPIESRQPATVRPQGIPNVARSSSIRRADIAQGWTGWTDRPTVQAWPSIIHRRMESKTRVAGGPWVRLWHDDFDGLGRSKIHWIEYADTSDNVQNIVKRIALSKGKGR